MGLHWSGPGDVLGIGDGRLGAAVAGFDLADLPSGEEQNAPYLAENKSLYKIIFYLCSYTCSLGLYRF